MYIFLHVYVPICVCIYAYVYNKQQAIFSAFNMSNKNDRQFV